MFHKIKNKSAIIGLIAAFFTQLALAADPVVCNGCVNTQDIAAKSIITSKIQDKAVTSDKIAVGAVVKNINGLKDNLTITGNNGIQVSSSGNSIVVSGSTTSATNDPKGIVSIDSSNYTQTTISNGDYIKIDGQIMLAGDLELFRNKENLHINGGQFQGTGSEVIYFTQGTIIENTTFSNVKIRADLANLYTKHTKFSNCVFLQIGGFDDSTAIIDGASIKNITARIELPVVENSYILNDTMISEGLIIKRLAHSYAQNAKLYISDATNNTLSNVSIFTDGGYMYFDSNICNSCDFFLRTSDGGSDITNNKFIRPKMGYYDQNYIIKIQEDNINNNRHSISRIENNLFTNEVVDGRYYVDIAIDGAFNNPLAILNISHNTFINSSSNKADKAISDTSSGNLKKIIQGNITTNITLGIADDGVGIANNLAF